MQLKIIGSGSSGNSYILENLNTALIIECGVPMKQIKQALDFNLNKVAGAIISHEHKDHCKSVSDVCNSGINVYCSPGTWKAMGVFSHRIKPVHNLKQCSIGEFKILPFLVKHDAKEPFGFLIHHPDCGNVLFLTDSYYVTHKFQDLNNIIIEANYSSDIVNQRLSEGGIHAKLRERVIESHMSIDTCKELLKANDLSAVNNIVLIHLSDSNSNANEFKQQVQELTGKTVTVAEKGMSINFSKTPF